ncbi:MAG: phosphatase PAP2 family protein [Bacteroidia bacterium]|nr:phosphatase PAP2 family protein [Bacteroidia bacterium]
MNKLINSIDEEIFLALNGSHSQFLDGLMLFASNLFSSIPILMLVACIATLYYKKQGYSHPVAKSVMLTTVLLLGFLFCLFVLPHAFSFLFERTKPCLNPNISTSVRMLGEDCNSSSSFFAVRPCIMFFITSFLFFTIKNDFPWVKAGLITWSLLVSYSRIYLGVHYPFNVLIADLAGILFGFILSRFYFFMKYEVFA